jgi:hypothetical protein
LNSLKNVLKNISLRNLIPIKFKPLLAEKCREGLDEESHVFCDGINGMYSRCVEYLGVQIEPVEDFLFNVYDI